MEIKKINNSAVQQNFCKDGHVLSALQDLVALRYTWLLSS